jgi:hypothetical protein
LGPSSARVARLPILEDGSEEQDTLYPSVPNFEQAPPIMPQTYTRHFYMDYDGLFFVKNQLWKEPPKIQDKLIMHMVTNDTYNNFMDNFCYSFLCTLSMGRQSKLHSRDGINNHGLVKESTTHVKD